MHTLIRLGPVSLFLGVFLALTLQGQNSQPAGTVSAPPQRVDAPAPGASPEELERRGDELREGKNYLDAVDFYRAAVKGAPGKASLFNKIGICQLQIQHFKEAKKNFERAIRLDRKHADAYNNLGVVDYEVHNYNAAIRQYEKAISLQDGSSSFYSNLGAAYFVKKQFDKAIQNYSKAVQLDPDIFERTSHSGVQAQLASPEDRAHYDYVVAKLYAKNGSPERSLHYLKKAREEGYKDINNVYTDEEFNALRKDPRFTELMAAKTIAIPE